MFRRIAPPLTACALASFSACSPPATPNNTPPPAASSTPDASPLAPGILAETHGPNGIVRVELRDGLRVLTIDGVVQGAVDPSKPFAPLSEPIAALLRAFRPKGGSALVIGLGTGRTASALAATGWRVDAVEIDPAVASFAKSFFDYQAPIAVGDGLAFARASTRTYDAILVDADLGPAVTAHLLTDDALGVYRSKLGPDGVLAIRITASPEDAEPATVFRRMPHHLRLMFGTGVGAEPQNLFLLSSEAPLYAEDLSGVPAWPVLIPGGSNARVPGTVEEGARRRVSVLGYIVRIGDELCLDLPHWEMGAIRYVLTGAEVDRLRARLAPSASFPTAGDIGSDGDLTPTLAQLLGGGGVKRSDVRFSPLAAKLTGTMQPRSITHPDDAWMPRGRELRRRHPMLPYGGVLYELEVESIDWSFDKAQWERLRSGALRSHLATTIAALERGEVKRAADALVVYRQALVDAFGSVAPALSATREVDVALSAVGAEGDPKGDYAIGVACDRASARIVFDGAEGDVQAVRRALVRCAVARYERALGGEGGEVAAGRLIDLVESGIEPVEGGKRILEKVERMHPGAEAISGALPQ